MRRHNFDPISFILGALFAAVGLTFLFGDADIGDLHIAVVWPLPLIVIGLLMLVTAVQRRTRNQPAEATGVGASGATLPNERPEPTPTPTQELLDDDDLLAPRRADHDLLMDEAEDEGPLARAREDDERRS
jgi:hypothetical protein